MPVEELYVYALRKPEKDAESPGDSDGCELLYMSCESSQGHLEEQPEFLTSEPSLTQNY